jgi:hypothetical protein
MAWQLHYTSARSGPEGRAGFQFVAETPDLPPGLRVVVTPLMTYRPPPLAPLSPAAADLARFPVALSYDRMDGLAVLVRSRYLGRDYSGRYGNFLSHTVVAGPGELEGVRPIEFWRARLWQDVPGEGALPWLDELTPGEAFDPEVLAEWLADQWDSASSYDLLSRLIETVAAVLARGHGRVTLVAQDAELVAGWIAVVSYSLPVPAAALMSFITYTADPGTAPQRVVGTTPEIWETARPDGPAFFLDSRQAQVPSGERARERPPQAGAAGRYARTAAACWRDFDFAGLDAMGELTGLVPSPRPEEPLAGATAPHRGAHDGGLFAGEDPSVREGTLETVLDQAATLLGLCRGDDTITPEEEARAAALLAAHGDRMPGWIWRDLAAALPGMGFDLALAIMRWAAEPAGSTGPAPFARRSGPARAAGLDTRTDLSDLAGRCAARCVVLALRDPSLRSRLPAVELPPPALARLLPLVEEVLPAAPDLTEVALIAELTERAGAPTPGPVVQAAAAGCARRGAADLAEALDRAPERLREAVLAGALAGLEAADDQTRAAVLDDAACDLVYGLHETGVALPPAVSSRVLCSVGRRHPDRRVEVTRALLDLTDPAGPATGVEDMLRAVWEEPATVAECGMLLDALGPSLSRSACLLDLPSRTFIGLTVTGDGLDAPETTRLADRLAAVLSPGDHTVADAAVVRAYAEAAGPGQDRADVAARRLEEICAPAAGASTALAEGCFACAAQRSALRPPAFRAALLAALRPPCRARLVAWWTEGHHGRAARNELVEVAIRLRLLGVVDGPLEDWASALTRRRLTYLQLDSRFRRHDRLRAGLKELASRAGRRPRGR